MKIAVALKDQKASAHFGKSDEFAIYDIRAGEIIGKEILPSPGHGDGGRGAVPNFLIDQGVNIVISAGMGQGASEIFQENRIQVILGNTGQADDLVATYLEGNLETKGSMCSHHSGQHRCGCRGE